MFTHMFTGTNRAGGHSHLDTRWGLSCFSNCFPNPTQPIQSHLYELNLIHKRKHLGWTQICRFIISCGRSREGQERQKQQKVCKRKAWNEMTHSLTHTHPFRRWFSSSRVKWLADWFTNATFSFSIIDHNVTFQMNYMCLWKNVCVLGAMKPEQPAAASFFIPL